MNETEFKRRTRDFGLRTAKVCDALPGKRSAVAIGNQLVRSGFSVSANYRAACRAKSRRDMISKLSTVEEELDESINWLEVLGELGHVSKKRLSALVKEGNELLAMVVASIKTLRARESGQQAPNPKSKS